MKKPKEIKCICGYPIYHGETFEWDGVPLCSAQCREQEFLKEDRWDFIAGNIGFDREGKILQEAIRDFVKRKQEEVITFIGNTQGWEESTDFYRKHFRFKKIYGKK